MAISGAGITGLWPRAGVPGRDHQANGQDLLSSPGIVVNDVHSRLNSTRVARVVRVERAEDLQRVILAARAEGRAVGIAGGRHAMGSQQFATDGLLIDTSRLDRVLSFDEERGEIEVEAGIQWPALLRFLRQRQHERPPDRQWGIIQKQTGADFLTIGGALSANIHGRGLAFKPFVDDIVAFTLVGPDGEARRCSREENPELFRLAIGGYGLFGVVSQVRLRLARRHRLERVVTVLDVDDLIPTFDARLAAGFTYGDFQFAIDPVGDDFLRRGVFSCYRPIAADGPISENHRALAGADWRRLLMLAHTDKRRAVDTYTAHYLATSGQRYWSDEHQMAEYVDGYHGVIDARLGGVGSEMITELYVPRSRLADFFAGVRDDARAHDVDLIYGTVRLIERDDETVLAWAREPWACVVINLHVDHTPAGLAQVASDFRRLIDRAIAQGGSFYLTYHRFATLAQVERCHPRFLDFLRQKRAYDPEERFQSDWYRHYRRLFAPRLDSTAHPAPAATPASGSPR